MLEQNYRSNQHILDLANTSQLKTIVAEFLKNCGLQKLLQETTEIKECEEQKKAYI